MKRGRNEEEGRKKRGAPILIFPRGAGKKGRGEGE